MVVVLEASDTSQNTHDKLTSKCAFYGVPLYRLPVTTEELARAIGKSGATAAVGITDESFVRMLTPFLQEDE